MKNGKLLLSCWLCVAALASCAVPGGTPNPTRGSIGGTARYSNATASAGIVISVEKLDASMTSSVRASIAARAIVVKGVTAATTTAEDGSYAFTDLEQGDYTIYASSQSSRERAVTTNVKVEAGKSVTPADLLLTETGSISGTILVSASESDNGGAIVFVAGTSFMAITDASGAFVIDDIPVGTTCSLEVAWDSFSAAPIPVTVESSAGKSIGTIDETLDIPWTSGHGSPSIAAGTDGKSYINVTTGAIFRKQAGSWHQAGAPSPLLASAVTWQGTRARHPADPPVNAAYYDSSIGIVYLWNGSAWKVLWKDTPPSPIVLHRELLASSSQSDFAVVGLGWDPGDPGLVQFPPDNGPGVAAPGFGASSFFSNVQGSQNGRDGPRYYSALRIRPQAVLGLTTVTLGDLLSVSYMTRQQNALKQTSWQLKIYTEPPGGPAYPQWYGHRLNSVIPTSSDIDWHENSTGVLLCDRVTARDPGGIESTTRPVSQTMSQAIGAATFAGETILWIDIIAGYATAGPEVYSYLDGVTIALRNGKSIVLDLGD